MQDYRDVIDYFIAYGDDSVSESNAPMKNVKEVKISCHGDQIAFGAEKYIAVDVSRSRPVFQSEVPPISRLVGFPVHVRQYPPDKLWKNGNESDVSMNQAATLLHLEANPGSERWVLVPLEYQQDVISALVVGADGKDVTTHQLEALCKFSQYKMQPAI